MRAIGPKCHGVRPGACPILLSIVAAAAAIAAPAPAQVVIHEILQNPAAVADGSGEWFELFNAGGAAVDINGWTLEDNDFDSHVINNGGPLVIPAGGYLVLGNNANSGTNGGVTVGYQYSSFFLANGADELVLLDTFLTEIDRVEWDGGPAFPDPNGASMALIAAGLDNNVGANWCTSSTPFGSGDLGTPGAANDCPGGGAPVINEIDYDQPGTDTAEFVELYNGTGGAIDLSQFRLVLVNGTGGGATIYDTILLPAVSLAAGDFFVVCANAATVANCDLDDGPDTNFIQNGAPDAVALERIADGLVVDAVSYEGDTGAPYTEGSGAGLEDDPSLADFGISRCPDGQDSDVNNVDLVLAPITPGAANDCAPPVVAELVIHEIMQNPAAVADGAGEWFELHNPTAAAIDIDGFTIRDAGADNHGISNGGPLVVPAGGYLVLGNNADFSTNGGVIVDYQYPSNFFLANGDDELILLDGSLNEVDRVEWDGGPAFPDPNGASMALADPALDNNVGGNWCTSSTPFGDGDLGTPGAANDCPQAELVINEIDYDQPGSDNAEFIEIANVGGAPADLSLYRLDLVNGTGGGAAVYRTFALPDVSLAAGDYFVICGDALNVASCDLDVAPNTDLIQNGAPDAVALVLDASGAIVDTVSYEGDTGAPYTEGSGTGLVDLGLAGEDFKGISRIPDGVDTDQNNVDFTFTCITPGATNSDRSSGCTATGPAFEIWEIQGAGSASPFAGSAVTTVDNVVTAVGPDGFFMQTPAARTDGDADTSDGIFVFAGGAPGVAVGDEVSVFGQVVEFFDFTELTAGAAVTVTGTTTLPAPVTFDALTPSPDPTAPSCSIEFECYEGMLISIADGTVSGPNQRFGTDPIAEVHVTAAPARTFREPGIEFPGLTGLPIWDGNPEVFELDPDKLGLPNQIIPAGSSFSAVGVLGFEFGGYELWPTELTVAPAALPVAVRDRVPGEMTVGSLNLFRLFDDVDDPADTNALGDTRNDTVVSTAEYQRRLAKFSTYVRDVLGAPDVLAVQEAEKLDVLADLALRIAVDDPSILYTPILIEGNDIGTIDVGFLVREGFAVDAVTQLGAAETYFNVVSGQDEILHDRPPLLLEGRCLLDYGEFPLAVIAVHNRSLGSIDDPVQGVRVRDKRLQQARSIAEKVQAMQMSDPDLRLAIVGDFNAFEFTDGYVDAVNRIRGDFVDADDLVNDPDDLVDPDLTNQVVSLPAEERYSFIFAGSAQVLDHALTTTGLDGFVNGFAYGRGNADAAVDLINSTAAPDLPLRSSDHDGLVLYVLKDADADGVPDDRDICLGTAIPESAPASGKLNPNHFALVDGDGIFDTESRGRGNGPGASFTVGDTGGCSCEQIVEAMGLGAGHLEFGCSLGAIEDWIALLNGS